MTTSFIAARMTVEVNKLAPHIREAYIAVGMIIAPMFNFARRQLTACTHMEVV